MARDGPKTDDRIIFIQTVCNENPNNSDVLALHDRMARCGLERACQDPLTTVDGDFRTELYDPHFYGKPFQPREAEIFCAEFGDRDAAERVADERVKAAIGRACTARNALSGPDAAPGMAPKPPTPKKTVPGRWRLPPHYLAALSPAQRAELAAYRGFEETLQSCRVSHDWTIDVDSQPAECPLGSGHRLFPLTERLAGFNNQEALLFNESEAILVSLARHLTGRETAAPEALLERTDRLYAEHCPASVRTEEFYPPICHNGRTIIRAALESARRL